MKNAIFTLTLLAAMIVAGQTRAQDNKRFWIGGNININSTKYPEFPLNFQDATKSFNFQPEFGYAFSDCWSAGMLLIVGIRNSTVDDGINETIAKGNDLGFAPFARYTALEWKQFRIFVDGGASYKRENYKQSRKSEGEITSFSTTHSDEYGIFIHPGFALYLSPRIALIGSMSLFNVTYEHSSTYLNMYDNEPVAHRKGNMFSATFNSPFKLDYFTVGLNFNF